MKIRKIATSVAAILLGIALTLAGGQPNQVSAGVDTGRSIDEVERTRILHSVSAQLRDGYIYEEKGDLLAERIAAAAEADRFSENVELGSFVLAVNSYMLELSDDRHLSLRFGSEDGDGAGPRRVVRRVPADGTDKGDHRGHGLAHGVGEGPGDGSGRGAGDGSGRGVGHDDSGTLVVVRTDPGDAANPSDESDHGIREVKVLDGNVGYLDLRMFAGSDAAKAEIDAAMMELEDTSALIIDVGRNGGGGPWMVRYLSGFLFDEPTHLADTWMRGMEEPRQRWTLAGQPTEAFHDKPVFVLTSGNTFSAAESFTFGLAINDRVTVVGERTGGGGHFGDTVPVAEDLRLFVPRGRTYDPATGKGWEAEGIEPDTPVEYGNALTRALDDAGTALGRASIHAARNLNAWLAG
jgi:hypothetical protein